MTSADKGKERPSLPWAAKTQSLEQEKKPEKKEEDYESSVARHLIRMMFAPVPTKTIHFLLLVFVCPSLVLT